MRLLRVPKEPPASAMYLFGHHMDENQEWQEFLSGGNITRYVSWAIPQPVRLYPANFY
jgi:hypothetical protein